MAASASAAAVRQPRPGDQFGGERGKKFKAKNFKNLLLSIENESMKRQKELINEAFNDWRGSLDQLDDVCVIGMRF